jgi:lysophospholipase L1-like esterase
MRVVNLDRAVPTAEFLDNAHLTAPGQQRLAALLAAALPR